jgi:membrane protein DedA with SNARE-associated domain/membrane-associated phospholipid phosphatase
VNHLADVILSLEGAPALLVVFLLPALECSAFVGLIFPGEIAVLLGGVLAFEGRISLVAALAAAISGAIIGDAVGYAVGRRFGRRMLDGTVGRFVKPHHVDRAEGYLRERGGKAVLFGRFTAALRVLVPGLAGMSGMPYRRFAAWNVAGGVVWGVAFVLLGYAAGDSWREVESVAKRASLVLLFVVLVLIAGVLLVRWVLAHREGLQLLRDRLLERPRIAAVRRRYRRQLAFAARRVRPEGALGLTLTASLLVLGAVGWAFSFVIRGVAGGDATRVDTRVLDFFVHHREPWLTTMVKAVTALGSTQVLVPVAAVVGAVWWWRRRSWNGLLMMAGSYAGAALLFRWVQNVTDRPRPPAGLALDHFSGLAFPSGHTTQAVAVWGMVAALVALATTSWTRKVVVWAAAALVAVTVGVSRLYLGAHWFTDVLGGWTLGALWLVALLTAVRTVASLRGARRDRVPT